MPQKETGELQTVSSNSAKTDAFQRLYDDTRGAIVLVRTESGTGTGFFIDHTGGLLTANHVISGARHIECITTSGFCLPVSITATDVANDLALLKVIGDKFRSTPLSLGESLSLQVGERLVSVSHQLGATESVIGLGRHTNTGLMPGGSYRVWSTALTKQGSSGGPIFNIAGSVVGLTSAGDASFTAAIPAERLAEFLASCDSKFVVQHKPSGWLADRIAAIQHNPPLAILDTSLVSAFAYSGYLLNRRIPRAATSFSTLSTALLGCSDYKSWMTARNDSESTKSQLALCADAAMSVAIGVRAIHKGRLGYASLAAFVAARLAIEFYPTRTLLERNDDSAD